MRKQLIASGGSVANIAEIPSQLKDIYRTVWEIKQKSLIDMAADRGAFIDQSQSLNLFVSEPDFNKLTSMHFYGWKKGLKTGMYYLRTKPAAQAIQFTVEASASKGKATKRRWTPKPRRGLSSLNSEEDDNDDSNNSDDNDDSSSEGTAVFGEVCTSCSG